MPDQLRLTRHHKCVKKQNLHLLEKEGSWHGGPRAHAMRERERGNERLDFGWKEKKKKVRERVVEGGLVVLSNRGGAWWMRNHKVGLVELYGKESAVKIEIICPWCEVSFRKSFIWTHFRVILGATLQRRSKRDVLQVEICIEENIYNM